MYMESRQKITPINEIKTAAVRQRPVPRMRTIPQAAEEANISVHFVRKIVKEGRVIAVKSGCKYYVNLDSLINYLNTGDCTVRTAEGVM